MAIAYSFGTSSYVTTERDGYGLQLFAVICVFFSPSCFAAEESVVEPGQSPVLLQEEGAGEGPAWHPDLGLLTSGGGHIYRRDRTGKTSVYRKDAGTNGLMFDRLGRLVMCEPASRRVSRMETNGTLKVLADRYEGKRFNQPTAGVYVFSVDGKLQQFIPIPRDETTNCAFGGDDLRTLFVTAGGSLWSVRLTTRGRSVWVK